MSRGEYRVGPGYVVGTAFYMRKGSECPSSPFAHNLTRNLATPTNPELHRAPMQCSTFTGEETNNQEIAEAYPCV